jgi:hypothetical protein
LYRTPVDSTGLVRAGHFIKADGKGEKGTHNLRKMKKGQVDESIALQGGDTIDMDDSPIIPGLRALKEGEQLEELDRVNLCQKSPE